MCCLLTTRSNENGSILYLVFDWDTTKTGHGPNCNSPVQIKENLKKGRLKMKVNVYLSYACPWSEVLEAFGETVSTIYAL